MGISDWELTKGDFADYVCKEFYGNAKKYGSLKNATKILYAKHFFPWDDWDVDQCYENVKKKSI